MNRIGRGTRMRSFGIGWLLLLFSLIPSLTIAQWNATAELDTSHIRIGEQPTLTLTLQYQDSSGNKKVTPPRIGDTISEKVEVVEKGKSDTLRPHEKQAPELRKIVREVRITSFDSGHHPIPPFPFVLEGDTVETEPLLLRVGTVELGENPKPRPIKDIRRFPYSWQAWLKDHWPWFAVAGGLLLIALLLFLYFRRKKGTEEAPVQEPTRPPEEVAIERLKELKENNAPREMEVKAFYTELSAIVREYLENRYQIPALEETTVRIVHQLSILELGETDKGRIRKLLRSADLAKFAKQRPSVSAREAELEEGVRFVESTRPPRPENTEESSEEA